MPTSSQSRDLVLGLIHGYTADRIRPFVNSLRKVAPDAKILLACSQITEVTRGELLAMGCELLPYRYYSAQVAGKKLWPGNTRWSWFHKNYSRVIDALSFLSAEARLRLKAKVVRHFLDPNTRRFVEFFLALESKGRNFDRVLLSDLRDVVFQSNPFDLVHGNEIVCSLEDDSLTIGSNWANSLWVERVGGSRLKEELSNRRISCVGVLVGSGQLIEGYLRALVGVLTRPGINVANFHGADTGAHNIVVYKEPPGAIRFGDAHLGGIIGMHGLRAQYIRWTENGLLCDVQGVPFAIVHQYDRDPGVSQRLLSRLGA